MLKQKADLLRKRFIICSKNENQIAVCNKIVTHFCSNDYLGMSDHPDVKKSFIQGIHQYGIGSNSSALISGFYKPHALLEEKFAEFLQCEKAVLVSSGYHANIGLIGALANRHTTLVADKHCHASILDGIQLARCHHKRYAHQDINHLRAIAAECKQGDLVMTESVFSMEGKISPLPEIAHVAKSKQLRLLIDDAHGIGILGEKGRGAIEHFNLRADDIACLSIPLGKAFGGMGAIIAGSDAIIEQVIQFSRSYRYSTALPPAMAQALVTSLNIIEKETWRRQKLRSLIHFFIQEALKRQLILSSTDITPIKCILIGDNLKAVKIKNDLFKQGYFISCIRPPTVPKGGARIRLSLNCFHTEKDILQLLDLIANAYEKFS